MLAHAYDCFPYEACGLLIGTNEDALAACTRFVATDNVAHSAKLYEVDARQHLRAEIAAEDAGESVIGVMHTHTHTDPYPSPTDIASAPDPSWHYVIVSLRDEQPMLRSWLVSAGSVQEEPVLVALSS